MKIIVLLAILITAMAIFSQSRSGFYFRVQPGFGFGGMQYGEIYELSGVSGLFSMQFGGTITENLILFGKLSGASMENPEVKVIGESLGNAEDTVYSVSCIGGGATYYWSDNYFLTGAVDLAVATLEIGDYSGESDVGLGIDICGGKEWMVSENWGLGLGLAFQTSGMKDKDQYNDYDIRNIFYGLVFSATYN